MTISRTKHLDNFSKNNLEKALDFCVKVTYLCRAKTTTFS